LNTIWDDDLAYFAGLLVGDGCVWLPENKFDIRIFLNVDAHTIEALGQKRLTLQPHLNFESNCYRLVFYDKAWAKFFHPIKYRNTWQEIPDAFFYSFLSGLFDADGYIALRPRLHRPHSYAHEVVLTNNNTELIKYVQKELAKDGIKSQMYLRKRTVGNGTWKLQITHRHSYLPLLKKLGLRYQRTLNGKENLCERWFS